MNIYLIRHTNVDIEPGVCYGQADILPADTFDDEKDEVISKLPDFYEPPVIYSSPLQRCTKLAKAFPFGEVKTDARLKELNFGRWELKKWDHISDSSLQKWMDDFVNVSPPGGESYQMMSNRIAAWGNELSAADIQNVLVVTHGGVIRCLLSQMLEMPLCNSFKINIDCGSLSAIKQDGRYESVMYMNR